MSTELPPHLFVILGATGDLTSRKLLPALDQLHGTRTFPAQAAVLGAALEAGIDDERYRVWAREAVSAKEGPTDHSWIDDRLFYQAIPSEDPDAFGALARRIAEIEAQRGLPGHRVFYLALPPKAVPPTLERMAAAGLDEGPGWTRIVMEKPFGFDVASAEALDEQLHRHFTEDQIYRIDHYLGKETVQNLLAFRFANGIFESLWNRDRVDSVQITVAETLGVEARAGYYDGVGAVRDMLQNHLLQLLSIVTMEVPLGVSSQAVRAEKTKALRAIAPLRADHVVLGQYADGRVGDSAVAGYQAEPGIPSGSRTPTFVAARLEIESWRWKGVPFFLRTGKRLGEKTTRISIVFREPPVHLFGPLRGRAIPPNVLDLHIQPDEGVSLSFQVKCPGQTLGLTEQRLAFGFERALGPLADAYETLLYDVVEGDQTHFVTSEAIALGWQLVTPVLAMDLPVRPYAAGCWGPEEAETLLTREGRRWLPERPRC